jgi:hypothetical protein
VFCAIVCGACTRHDSLSEKSFYSCLQNIATNIQGSAHRDEFPATLVPVQCVAQGMRDYRVVYLLGNNSDRKKFILLIFKNNTDYFFMTNADSAAFKDLFADSLQKQQIRIEDLNLSPTGQWGDDSQLKIGNYTRFPDGVSHK